MRDNIKDEQYFTEFIAEDLNRVLKLSKKIEMGEIKNSRIIPVKQGIFRLKLGIIIAKYSRGDNIQDLKLSFELIFKEWITNFFSPEAYNENLKMISLGILFNIGQDLLLLVKQKLVEYQIIDWLYCFLLNYKMENTPFIFYHRFHTLKDVVEKTDKINFLVKYLMEEWYNKDCEVYESHKSVQSLYYGYWSFEAGAVAKILRLNDSKLKGVPYYPYDLVHYGEQKNDTTKQIYQN